MSYGPGRVRKKKFLKWRDSKRKTPGRVLRALIVEDKAANCFTTGLDRTGEIALRASESSRRRKKKQTTSHLGNIMQMHQPRRHAFKVSTDHTAYTFFLSEQ